MTDKLIAAMSNMKEAEALKLVGEMLEKGIEPVKILDCCTQAMETVGKRFEAGQYFLPELMMAGEMLKQISDLVKPKLSGKTEAKKSGKVLIGTVEGDIHDIGKDIVIFLLDVNGFDVHDLGIDVPPAKFVDEIKMFKPQVVGLSGLLTVAYDSMKNTVAAITAAGLRDKVKIMIGGGQMSEKINSYAGSDAYAKDAMHGVALAKEWIGDN